MAEEVCIQAVINCQEIQDLGDESIVRSRRRTFIMELRWFTINIKGVIDQFRSVGYTEVHLTPPRRRMGQH